MLEEGIALPERTIELCLVEGGCWPKLDGDVVEEGAAPARSAFDEVEIFGEKCHYSQN